jgi:hypothetical protein
MTLRVSQLVFLISAFLISSAVKSAPPTLTGFSMVWAFCDANGANMRAWEDVCLGSSINIKNRAVYNGNSPIPNTLTGSYWVWNDQGSSILIATIPAASWPYNGVYSVPINSYFNYSSGLNIRIEYVGPGATTAPTTFRYMSLYLSTRALPNVNAGADQSICQGASAVLTATGASSYIWNPSGSTTPTITVTPSVPTVYSVTGTITYNTPMAFYPTLTCVKSDAVTVNILPNPVAKNWVSKFLLCTGSLLPSLNAYAGTGSFSYQWSYIPFGSNTYISLPVTSSNLNTASYGYGYYTVIIANLATGCMSSYSSNVILSPSAAQNVNALFALNDQPSVSTLTINPTSTESGTHSWIVSSCDIAFTPTLQITTATSASFTYNLPLNGYYRIDHSVSKSPCNELKNAYVLVHYDNSGKKVLINEVLSNNTVSKKKNESETILISNMKDVNVSLYPNPVQNTINIDISSPYENEEVEIIITDLNGKILVSETKSQPDKLQLNTASFEAGMYFLTVKSNHVNYSQKIIKE